jgi:hypothetical protein
MTPAEITHKLAMIRTLSAGELQGWWQHFRQWREPFAGEVQALHQRERQLNVTLP